MKNNIKLEICETEEEYKEFLKTQKNILPEVKNTMVLIQSNSFDKYQSYEKKNTFDEVII